MLPFALTATRSRACPARLVFPIFHLTCANSSATAAPVAIIGALASFYDVSFLAVNDSNTLVMLPNAAFQNPVPAGNASLSMNSIPALSGQQFSLLAHHYFANPTTPVFNVNLSPQQ